MALALFFAGLILVITGVKGTQGQLAELLRSEFTGAGNFWFFITGIFFLGALGYFQPLRNTSRLMIALVLVVLILSNGGFWQQLVSAVQNPQPVSTEKTEGAPAPVDVKEASQEIGDVGSFLDGLAKGASAASSGGAIPGGGAIMGIIGKLF